MKLPYFWGKIVIVLSIAAVVGWVWFAFLSDSESPHDGTNATHVHVKTIKDGVESNSSAGKVIWTCSMHPQIQLPQAGKCPICFMDLIKLEIDNSSAVAESYRQINLGSDARKLAQIEVTPVKRQSASTSLRMVGKVDYDESLVGTISAWTAGRIDKMYISKTGSIVRKGQPMAAIYSPELYAAQAELIQAQGAKSRLTPQSSSLLRTSIEDNISAAKEKLRLLGLTKMQVNAVLKQKNPSKEIVIRAPQAGIVIKKKVVEGAYVKTGQPIYAIADLSKVWVVLEAYETDLPWIHKGDDVEFTIEAFPGDQFKGRVVYIDTMVKQKTRTVDVRLEVRNPQEKLKPGMFVQAVQTMKLAGANDPQKTFLVIPASAPLITGKRAVVYVELPEKEGTYEGREIVLGPRSGNYYIVKSGLKENERVVSKGAFKLDSALQIMAKPSMMSGSSSTAHSTNVGESLKAPQLFISKLSFLQTDFDALAQALRQQDNATVQSLFKRISQKISSIDYSMLEGESKRVWKEHGMLLTNDCVLGSEAETYKRQHEIFASAKFNYEALRTAYGIEKVATSLTPAMDVPFTFKKQLGHVLTAYIEISEALSKDDMEAARKGASRVISALTNVSRNGLSKQAISFWGKQEQKILQNITAMQEESDIATMREKFFAISKELLSLTERVGIALPGELYEVYCPMAFGNKGAIWLQQDEDIRNPYFGKSMLKCGEVKRQLPVE
ncbi:efflux RND transporter periplasmic adaptor subunit [Halodesulfovibrio aestuarii]|uniref:Membrane fusion protein, Cu(I)/Ag(I) efflux system n=1 Tax=Halodesulfovibrio aestuarii TaxID=126333 RepID=A0A8G2C8L8_9BACT|nr:efflux RND transporter periplasmic adaptor subunit [Halodesulfovibrio aestuarii]SHI83645.1 membrane fusion protein, Cu(I)/Ag(I) efflux system [Halodesulfovibrio aestuarii]